MIRGTTPTHIFKFPDDIVSSYSKINIVYEQSGTIILEKNLSDLTISGKEGSYILTQEETLMFKYSIPVQVQLRVVDKDNVALASKIFTIPVEKILKDGVL